MNNHTVVMGSCLAIYLGTNFVAAIKMHAFTMGRSFQRRIIDSVAFSLGGSVIVLGLGLMALMRRFDEWAQ